MKRTNGNPFASWVLACILAATVILWPAAIPFAGAQTSTPVSGATVAGTTPKTTPATVVVWQGEVLGSYPEGTILSFPFGYGSLRPSSTAVVLGPTSRPWSYPKETVFYVSEGLSEFTDCHSVDWVKICVSPFPWFGGETEIMQEVPGSPGLWYNVSHTTGKSWWPRLAKTADGRFAVTWSDSTSTSDPMNADVYVSELQAYPGGVAWNRPLQSSRRGTHPNVVADGTTTNAYFTADWDSGDLPNLNIRFAVTDTLNSPCVGLPTALAWDPQITGPTVVAAGEVATFAILLRNANPLLATGAAITITDSMAGTWIGDCGVDAACQAHGNLIELDELRPETEALVSFVGTELQPGQHTVRVCNNSFCQTKSLLVLQEHQQVYWARLPLVLMGATGSTTATTASLPSPRCKVFYREGSQPQLCR